jgi:hypothetical protein
MRRKRPRDGSLNASPGTNDAFQGLVAQPPLHLAYQFFDVSTNETETL